MLAEAHLLQGKPEQALLFMETAFAVSPDYASNYIRRSKVRIESKDLHGALSDARRAVQLRPESGNSHLALAAALMRLGDAKGCLEAVNEGIERPGDLMLALSLRSEALLALKDYDAAIRLNPNFPVALNNRAWAYFKMGRPAAGLPDVESSILLDPRSAHSYDTRAHIHQWMGRPGTAILDYDRAMYFGGERMIKLYQCGLQNHGLYSGPINGQSSTELRRAIAACVETTDCDPLPPDEECRAATS
jgi:tetratricopeptide (TPR) repeat protein